MELTYEDKAQIFELRK